MARRTLNKMLDSGMGIGLTQNRATLRAVTKALHVIIHFRFGEHSAAPRGGQDGLLDHSRD